LDEILLENYPPLTIQRLSNGILNGTSDDEDGILLMRLFCLYVDEKKDVPTALNLHFSKVFKSIFKDNKEAKNALSIIKNNHPNHPSKKYRIQLAYAFLLYRLNGIKTKAAYDFIANEFGWNRTAIYAAWKEYGEDAINMFKLNCKFESKIISDSEQKILNKILKKKS
jgi:hypothetical protein